MGVIYKITSPSSKVYIGKTYDLRKRINAHKGSAKKSSNIILHNSIRKYGWDAHILEVIEEVEDSLLNEREVFWICELKTYCYENAMGLNMTKGGEGQRSTWMHKTELRKWYSEKFSGEGNPFYGKTHSEDVKMAQSKRMSKINKEIGRKIPEWGVEKGRDIVRKPVVCYDNNGNFLSEFISATEAGEKLGIQRSSVNECCNNVITAVIGRYIFKYKIDGYALKIDPGVIQKKNEKRPVVLMNKDFEPIAEFPSALEASEFTGIPKTTINRAAQYNFCKPIRTGHVFLYRDMYDEVFKEAI